MASVFLTADSPGAKAQIRRQYSCFLRLLRRRSAARPVLTLATPTGRATVISLSTAQLRRGEAAAAPNHLDCSADPPADEP